MTPSRLVASLASRAVRGATASVSPVDLQLDRFKQLIVTLKIYSAERDSADETYDVYVTTGDGKSTWDLVHFPQVATTGAKIFTARITNQLMPQNVTTAAPGVAAVDSGTIATGSGQANVIKSLAAGSVRQGPWGPYLGHELVVAGTVATGIDYEILITAA